MKYHLFYHDGQGWKMLGPIWRALRLVRTLHDHVIHRAASLSARSDLNDRTVMLRAERRLPQGIVGRVVAFISLSALRAARCSASFLFRPTRECTAGRRLERQS